MHRGFSILILFFTFLLFTSPVAAQEAIEISELLEDDDDISIHDMSRIKRKVIVSDTLEGWQLNLVGGLNGAQASYNNWSQGGVNTVSVTASTVFDAKYRQNRFAYALATNFKYGQARLEDQGNRKTDDRVAVNNKFSYLFDSGHWSAFGNINFSTQFDRGYNYGEDPPELISKFFAPAYFTQIVGIAYSPTGYFSAEAGLAAKETIVTDTNTTTIQGETLPERYGLGEGEKFRFEPGYALAMNFEKEVFSNVQLNSSIETFTNLQRHIDKTDVNFSNELIGEVNDVMNMSIQFVMVYNSDYSRELQIKQVLSVGLSYSFL